MPQHWLMLAVAIVAGIALEKYVGITGKLGL